MSSAWLLPEHIADVLPREARRVEELRRKGLDRAARFGYELVMPPLLEYLESLLAGSDHALDLRTFKLVDQLSGRTMGVRADTTPQVARIDAHLLAREGVARLCYCGPVLHTRPAGAHATREPLQFGAEVYGHAGLEADLEVIELALDGLADAGIAAPVLDLADARIVRSVLAGAAVDAAALEAIVAALAAKDRDALDQTSAVLAEATRTSLESLLRLDGGDEVLDAARRALPVRPALTRALDDLGWLARHLRRSHPSVRIGFDLGDVGGYGYYSGMRFTVYTAGSCAALVRGGRYDEIGAVFGRNRPAVGFSLDLKALAGVAPGDEARPAIRAPWGEDLALRDTIRVLRARGDAVVCALPGHEAQAFGVACDRELAWVDGQWTLRAL